MERYRLIMRIMKQIGNQSQPMKIGMTITIIGILLMSATLRAPITVLSPLIGSIRAETGIGNAMAGMLTTLPLLAFSICSLLAPKMARRIGTEWTLFTGLLLITFGLVVRYFNPVWMLFAGTALVGVGIALGNVLLPSLVKRDFQHHLGIMTGAYAVVMNGMAGLASGISIPLSSGMGLGWRGALSIWVIPTFIILLIWIPLLKQSKPSLSANQRSKRSLWSSTLAWQVTFFMGLQSLFFYITIAWMPEILQAKGFSEAASGWILSSMQFVSLPATFIIPIMAARFHNQRGLVSISMLGLLVGVAGMMVGNQTVTIISVLLMGICCGAAFSLATMFFMLRARDSETSAELSGMAQSVGYLLAAAGPTVFGLLHDLTNSWLTPLWLLILSAVLMWAAGMGAGRKGYVSESIVNDMKRQSAQA